MRLLKNIADMQKMLNAVVANDYKEESGYVFSCGLIAYDIARRALVLGERPMVVEIQEDVNDGVILTSKPIKPRAFNGKVTWFSHQVCVVNVIVYDPIIKVQMKLEDYANVCFQEPIAHRVLVSIEKMEEFLSRIAGYSYSQYYSFI